MPALLDKLQRRDLPAADRHYWMVRLGPSAAWAGELRDSGQIAVDFVGDIDLTPFLSSTPRPFHDAVQPLLRQRDPQRSKISLGLAVGNLWVATCSILKGDVVLSPLGDGRYLAGVVVGPYFYESGTMAAHRRKVSWDSAPISRSSMSPSFARAMVPAMTVYNLDTHAEEIELLRLGGASGDVSQTNSSDPNAAVVDTLVAFQLEKQLEDFLVQNWANTSLGKEFDLYEDENGTGQQYQTDTGPLDLLAVSKDGKTLLVIELKRGRASDAVVGQVMRYMGFVKRELLESGQKVRGLIIALEDDVRVRNALSVVPNIDFMTYRVKFELTDVSIYR
ncbi:MAG: endonuclease NucS domain-containing protein [Microbacteriaceae bacterium]